MTSVDVTVRGAGIFGLSVAWACVLRGATVRVVDPYGPAAGSSGGLVGALAPHVPENWNEKKAFQLDSLLMAGAYWAQIEAVGGVSAGYGRTGRLQPVADEAALALAQVRGRGAQELWQGRAVWQLVRVRDAGEFAPESPSGWLIHDTLTARMAPRRAAAALVAALTAHGVEIVETAEDMGAVVWATGWRGLEDLSEHLGRPVGGGVKGQSAHFRFDASEAAQVFVGGLHIIPHADGTVAIGSTSEREFDDPSSVDAQCETLIARAYAALPVLAGAEVIGRWAGVRPRARSRAPLLGAWPGRDGHFVANGGFKIGFGMAPKVGEVMADLVLDGIDTIPSGFGFEACFKR
ncbi:NAD(P)/FAD-dependent oxidoreductase [Pelagimonas varians]|uniref:Bifunctional tRNA (Mnm(5)s(2)U34)-methyltransferase/FAD-dependent cmnm(5)s(2)U34 oxidoreductase n=1 Tax=Pelagimonas varians TaxID=696760 RepID=A0A238K3A8_9RHOB|nr:FAD-binding oxidoreductase [Pelagimonas varians]PYG30509.1 glycine/D-amino acid oxidase-like deaminating enzyme [Pelagimonas varians]SMX37411.1 bifunctional tRNA (mnm(5)s(2)U34)-methyltransferase/FAD-dependent cmnm(5)s(2)U34 oxidoreductase [Pelagimonas varians]